MLWATIQVAVGTMLQTIYTCRPRKPMAWVLVLVIKMHSHHVGKTATHVGKTATHVGQVQDAAVCHGEQRLGRTSLPCLLKCITFAQPKHTACTTTCQMTCHRGCHQPSTPLSPQLPSTRHVASAWSQASRSAGDPLWCQCGGHH